MIWLIGNKGMLGSEIAKQFEFNNIDFVGTGSNVDITDYNCLLDFYNQCSKKNRINWIINCAAYTKVDKAEEESQLAEKINITGPRNIALLCKNKLSKMIHISTDYVFDGISSSPYDEDCKPNPLCLYGKTKAKSEEQILSLIPANSFIFRTAWLYGNYGNNFVFTMIKLMNTKAEIKIVNDQIGTPTNVKDLAYAICYLVKNKSKTIESGIYHFSNLGQTSWYDFAMQIYTFGKQLELITNQCKIIPCSTKEYGVIAKRPQYSVLSKDKIMKTFGIEIPFWKESLFNFMSAIKAL